MSTQQNNLDYYARLLAYYRNSAHRTSERQVARREAWRLECIRLAAALGRDFEADFRSGEPTFNGMLPWQRAPRPSRLRWERRNGRRHDDSSTWIGM